MRKDFTFREASVLVSSIARDFPRKTSAERAILEKELFLE